MTDRSEDDEFLVAPQPLDGQPGGGGGNRRRRLAVGMVVFGVATILAISWLGPRLASRPYLDSLYFATPTPTLGPPPALLATALPALTGDAGLFSGTVGVLSNGFRVLDLGTGQTIASIPVFFGRDVILPAPGGGGWVCVCMAGGSVVDVQLVHIDRLGHELDRRTIGRLGTASGPDRSITVQTDLDLGADGRTGVLAVAVQGPTDWTYSLASLDLGAGTLGPLESLGTQRLDPASPAASPTASDAASPIAASQTLLEGPDVRLAPGGDRAVVWGTLHEQGDDNLAVSESIGWTIRLDRHGNPMAVHRAPGLAGLPAVCVSGGFLGPDQFAAICADASSRIAPANVPWTWSIREATADGVLTRRIDAPELANPGSDMLFDTANGAIWTWNGTAMHLRRIDAATGSVTERTFARDAKTASGGEPLGDGRPVWVRPGVTVPTPFWDQMAGSPDGTRLYLLGYAEGPNLSGGPSSLGILVVDPRTLALLGRWAPDATYVSIRTGLQGTVVMASGLAGMDDRGEPTSWDASVTFHDAGDGRILARYGTLGADLAATIIEP
jgi:hypothetical protein